MRELSEVKGMKMYATEAWLVDPLLNERLLRITEESQIDLSVLASDEFAIEAVLPDGSSAGSVAFSINGETRIENSAPYASFGDRSSNFKGSTVVTGPVEVQILVFEERNGQGDVLSSLTTNFVFVDDESNTPIAPPTEQSTSDGSQDNNTPSDPVTSDPETEQVLQASKSVDMDLTTVLRGDYGYEEPYFRPEADNHLFDARDAIFRANITDTNGDASHPVRFATDGHYNGYLLGGLVVRDDPDDLLWDESYGVGYGGRTHNGGVYIVGREDHGSFTVDGTRIHNTHDGVVVGQGFGYDRTVVIKNVYGTNIRDDAFENDSFHNVIISDNLIDGAFVGYSSRAGSSAGDIDHSSERVSILQNNIIRLEKMPGAPTGDRTEDGHGRLFKLDGDRGPALVLKNNIFVVEQEGMDIFSGGGADSIAYSEGNTLIWMGPGSYQYDLPDGFELIEGDMSTFNRAKSDWLAEHGYDEGAFDSSGNIFRDDSSIIMGDGEANRLTGSSRDDVLVAGGGNDWVSAGDGDDVLYGNLGNDTLIGGAGLNIMVGGEGGQDTFVIGSGFDQIFGFDNNDRIEVSVGSSDALIELVSRDGDTIVRLDRDGSGQFTDVARVVGVNSGNVTDRISLTFTADAEADASPVSEPDPTLEDEPTAQEPEPEEEPDTAPPVPSEPETDPTEDASGPGSGPEEVSAESVLETRQLTAQEVAKALSLLEAPDEDTSPTIVRLIDASQDAYLAELGEYNIIHRGIVDNRSLTLAAEVDEDQLQIKRADLSIDGHSVRSEKVEPYALFGDKGGDYRGDLELDSAPTDINIAYIGSDPHSELYDDDLTLVVGEDEIVGRENEIDTVILDTSKLGHTAIIGLEDHDEIRMINGEAGPSQAEMSLDDEGNLLYDFGNGNFLKLVDPYFIPDEEEQVLDAELLLT